MINMTGVRAGTIVTRDIQLERKPINVNYVFIILHCRQARCSVYTLWNHRMKVAHAFDL